MGTKLSEKGYIVTVENSYDNDIYGYCLNCSNRHTDSRENRIKILESWSRKIRSHVVTMAHNSKSPHIGSALSCVDILCCLFFEVMDMYEDYFILSKGHGCMSYYAVLAEKKIFGLSLLDQYAKNGGKLPEHPPCGIIHGVPGIEIGTGSLGHGLAISLGRALARRIRNIKGNEFVLLGDGECNEGSVWESAMFAANANINNIIAIVDRNNMQCAGFVDRLNMVDKWKSFGWNAIETDGNNIGCLLRAFDELKTLTKPGVIIANTIKGKGISFMENELEWHYRFPNEQELSSAFKEINNA
ncbi:transketolase [Candidatus Pacearchaeota archaeon]|nr:transketolase [Candidatus Pacearchaeota archaeon]